MKRHKLLYSSVAREAAKILNPEIKPIIKESIEGLTDDPYSGKELIEELSGFRSLVIGKYRVIYRLNEPSVIEIHFIGHRRDVYMNFRKLLERTKV
ncbi:MAG: type II toxin-antitoxin system RelE/ParE family toxin [Deltaproteobacteria bacterium]|nr:type II toxin-antitoxin system RelE/ParE family toxin [Deltaproteobacteria bacterium]